MTDTVQKKLSRLFNPEKGKSITIPMDHGFYLGNIQGLEDPVRVLEDLLEEGIDATLLSFGLGKVTSHLFGSDDSPGRIISADCALITNVPGVRQGFFDFDLYIQVEQALKWGFEAVKVLLIWGLDHEHQMNEIKAIGELARQCDKWDIPLMIEPVLWGRHIPEQRKNDPEMLAHAARIAMEMGADILKVPYTGSVEHFRQLVDSVQVPVVILGGTDMSSTREVLRTAREATAAGGKGVVFGRVVWQNGHMRGLVRALKEVVYDQADEEQVMAGLGLA
jgi:class I fructose-bisphosphate aldolase